MNTEPNSDPQVWVEQIVFLNASTLLDNHTVSWYATVCAKQLRQDFCPMWQIPTPTVYFAIDEKHVDPRAQLVVFLDTSDAAGALAYHDFTPSGNPYSKVFCADGDPLISGGHECCEMVLDPLCDTYDLDEKTGLYHAREACDAVEAATYELDGEQVTDFVLPGFFGLPVRRETPRTGDQLLSFVGSVSESFQTAKGGYQIVKDKSGNVSQVFGDARDARRAAGKLHPAARTAARMAGKPRELRS